MATKLYLPSSGTAPTLPAQPGFDAGWTDTTQVTRYPTSTSKASTTQTTKSVNNAANTQQDILVGQWISAPLTAGQTITGAQTIQIVVLASEVSSSNNMFVSWRVAVYNGSTLQKTLIAKRNDATEVIQTTLTSRTDSASSTAGNYTTVAGDRIVIEVGLEGDPTGSNDHNSSLRIGDASASDLAYSDGVTTDNNPSVQLGTDTLTFLSEYSATNQTQTGKGRIQITTTQPQTGKSRISIITPQTITGVASIILPVTITLNNYKFVKVGDGMSTSEKIK